MEKLIRLPYLLVVGLLLYMPFHIFLSQWLSTYTGSLDYWKVGKDILLFAGILLIIGLVYIKKAALEKFFWLFTGLCE